MIKDRRKASAIHNAFQTEIDRLFRLNRLNQSRHAPGPGRPAEAGLADSQMNVLCEAILARAFAHYELFIEEIFLFYCRGKETASGNYVESYLNPADTEHARTIVKSSMNFLEWNSPDTVIERSKVYLEPDNPIFLSISTNRDALTKIRKLRNAIAHKSSESHAGYLKVLRSELRTLPASIPDVGHFLNMNKPRSRPRMTFLESYLNSLSKVAGEAAEV